MFTSSFHLIFESLVLLTKQKYSINLLALVKKVSGFFLPDRVFFFPLCVYENKEIRYSKEIIKSVI